MPTMPAMKKLVVAKTLVVTSLFVAGGTAAAQEEEAAPDEGAVADDATAPADGTVDASAPVEATALTAAPEAPPAEEPAEEPAAAGSLAPTISGFVAGTYNYNLMNPTSGATAFHSFTAAHNSFLLNTAHVAIAGSDDKLSYAVEIDGGTDGAATSPNLVQEAWLAYQSAGGLGFKAGKFVTYQGIEVIESPANPTISRGLLFNLAEPFHHTGVLLTYKASDTLDFAVGLVNGWDVEVDNNDRPSLVGKVGVTQDKLALVGSFTVGPEQAGNPDDYRISGDVTAVIKGDKMDIWVQGNGGFEQFGEESATWFGAGVQPVVRLSDTMTLGARAEVLLDLDGSRTGFGDSLTLITAGAAPAFKIHDHVWIRAEGRLDFATEDVLGDDADPGAIQVVGLGEAIVTF